MSVLLVLVLGLALLGGAQVPAQGVAPPPTIQGEGHGLDDVDNRDGQVAPTAAQKRAVSAMGATARWNRFGTPGSLIKYGGYLATGLSGNAVAAAKSFISTNKGLFRLSSTGVGNLEMINDSRLTGSQGHVVLFRQRFGTLESAQDGMIAVGVVGGKIAYVSSSAAGDGNRPASAQISAVEAWRKSAANVNRTTPLSDIRDVRQEHGWTVFAVEGFSQLQRSRLVALPTPRNGVRPVFETVVYPNESSDEYAYSFFVDAVSGAVLFRTSRTNHLGASSSATALAQVPPTAGAFNGSYGETGCGPMQPIPVPPGTRSISVAANAVVPDDIILNLYDLSGTKVASSDIPVGANPEAITYSPGGELSDTYTVDVCPFDDPSQGPADYIGAYSTSEQSFSALASPRWRYFTANPPMSGADTDTRIVGCFTGADGQT
ncbi:MAG: hypothetical protein M3524_03695, partial [Actinomycetota bacterium]|nr:hypothetical protein [Actinomycetota bacterium]